MLISNFTEFGSFGFCRRCGKYSDTSFHKLSLFSCFSSSDDMIQTTKLRADKDRQRGGEILFFFFVRIECANVL